jgi:hypothetical protein
MDKHSNRFVAVNLTDAEWRALRAVTPDPVAWMKTQIQRLLDESGVTPVNPPSDDAEEPSEWGALTSPGL